MSHRLVNGYGPGGVLSNGAMDERTERLSGGAGPPSGPASRQPAASPGATRAAPGTAGRSTAPSRARRLIPLAVLLAALVAFFAFGLQDWVELDRLRQHRLWLSAQVDQHYLLSLIAFILVYAAAVAISVPGGAVLTIAGGFLFGLVVGSIATVVAATIGAVTLFLAARSALGDSLRARAGPWLRKLESGFTENALSYLLVLRLVPLFPFFVVNLVPAFLGVTLRVYVIGTLFGIIPGTVVYTSVGAGLGTLFEAGEDLTLDHVLTPEIILGLVGLALLALLPVAYKKLVRRDG